MADDTAASTDDTRHITFQIKSANEAKFTLTLPVSTTIAEVKAKLASKDHADVPEDRQRLIYSGRVLKDADTLESIKIKDGNMVHLVKGAASNARQHPAGQGSSSGGAASGPRQQLPTNIAAGTGGNPLAGLTGARYAGLHGLPGAETFGPDGGVSDAIRMTQSAVVTWHGQMGAPPDPEQLAEMMEDPMFLSQFNELANNPQFVQIMEQSPAMRNNPALREALRNPELRRFLFSPEMMRMQSQMFRNRTRGPAFTAPGATDNTPQTGGTTGSANQTNAAGATPPQNPFAALFGGANAVGGGDDPLSSLLTAGGGANPWAPGDQDHAATNEQLQGTLSGLAGLANLLRAQGGSGQDDGTGGNAAGGGNAPMNPFGTLFNAMPPADNRPPEEVYEAQLRQLNDMGFFDFDRNVRALRRSGGNVQGAVEHLLTDTS